MRPPAAWASTRNTSFIGAEVNHLWPCRVYSPSTAVGRAWVTLSRTSEPPCFSVIPIPASAPALTSGGTEAEVVGRGGQPRRPLLGDGVVGAERRHRGVRHRDGAAVPGLGLRPGQEAGGAAHVGVRLVRGPRGGAEPEADAALHEPVPGGVEADLVDAVAVAVERHQLGPVPVGQPAVLLRGLRAGQLAELQQVHHGVRRAVRAHGVDECLVRGDHVVTDERRGLVGRYPVVDGHVVTVVACQPTGSEDVPLWRPWWRRPSTSSGG